MNYQEVNYLVREMGNVTYPPLVDVEPDYNFGKMVYDSYAGSKSELTTILTYTYEGLTNSDKEDMATLLGAISMQEMAHFKLLGGILVKMDLKPYYMNSFGNKWCSDNVRSQFTCIGEMLDFNIKSEIEAIEGYEQLKKNCKNESINSLLSRIIMDEKNHIEIFKMLKKQFVVSRTEF